MLFPPQDWADSFQRVARILPPIGGTGTNTYIVGVPPHVYEETVPTVQPCGEGSVLSPTQQQWNFTTRNVTNVDNSTRVIGDILVNNFAPATLPAWAGGSGTPSYPGPVLYNCQKQLILGDSVLAPGSRPPSPECTNATGFAFGQWQLILNATTHQLKTGIPTEASGVRLSYGFGAYTCASADHTGNVALAPCVEPVPPHQAWSYDPATLHLKVAGLGPSPLTVAPARDHQSKEAAAVLSPPTVALEHQSSIEAPTAGLCLTLAPHTVSYELDTKVVYSDGKAATVSTSYNLTTGSRYYATNALGMLDQEGEFYFVSHLRPCRTAFMSGLYLLPPPAFTKLTLTLRWTWFMAW